MKAISKKAGMFAAAMLMLATVSFAQEIDNVGNTDVDEFNNYDRNTDQEWDRDEYNTRMNESETFNEWDTDRDGSINEDEFNEGSRNWQNRNANTQGNTTVTNGNTGTSGTTNGLGTYNDWDIDRSGSIDQDEFNEGTYNTWDTDRSGTINNDEYNRGIGTGTRTGSGTGTGTGTGNDIEIGN